MRDCCGRLGVKLLFAKPYAAASKGKIEKYNRLVDNFLAEVRLDKVQTLAEYNKKFADWLSECYQNKAHSALPDGKSPQIAFQGDETALHFVPSDKLTEAFRHHAVRRVDKSGCISLKGVKYDVGWQALGRKVEVSFDPRDMSEIEVSLGTNIWRARKLEIGTHVGPRPQTDAGLTPAEAAKESRVLKAAAKKRQNRDDARRQAISYADMEEE
jgi:hypothetical protein